MGNNVLFNVMLFFSFLQRFEPTPRVLFTFGIQLDGNAPCVRCLTFLTRLVIQLYSVTSVLHRILSVTLVNSLSDCQLVWKKLKNGMV